MESIVLIVLLILSSYCAVVSILCLSDFNTIRNFFRYEAPTEIYVFKKENKIKYKWFDLLVISIFVFSLPITYYQIRREQ